MGLSEYNLNALSLHFTTDDIVIVAPLYWGLGHATRDIPIIYWLKANCKEVIIASDGAALDLLEREFPDLKIEQLPSYNIKYRFENIIANILIGWYAIIKAVFTENNAARSLTKKYNASIILSDNRLGFYNPQIKSLYMTHQINILHNRSWMSWLGTRLHRFFIKKYNHVLIPDYNGKDALCPKLSSGLNENTSWIGPISRINKLHLQVDNDIVIILSGPEPQRTILEDLLLKQIAQLQTYSIVFVRGSDKSMHYNCDNLKNVSFYNITTGKVIENLLNRSRLLITRSGYTTIMDIHHLDIKAIWIPTPGQTEQEYLAQVYSTQKHYLSIRQDNINNLKEYIGQLI